MVGVSVGSMTVMITIAWLDSTPSVTAKATVKAPGAWASLGVQVKVPLGAVPDAVEKDAPRGIWDPEIVRVGEGVDASVALTLNVRVVSSLTVCVDGTFSVGGTRGPLKLNVAIEI